MTEHSPYVATLNRGTHAETHQARCRGCGWTSGLPFNRYGWSRAFNAAREHADGVRR